jgi:Uma2 family endonuclease
MATATGLTIDDFERLPDVLVRNHELVDGELVDVSGNKPQHNELRDTLVELLRPFVRENQRGYVVSEQEYDFDGNANGPDVSFYNKSKRRLLACAFSGSSRTWPLRSYRPTIRSKS